MAQAQLVALIGELRAQLGEQPGVLLELLRRIQARVGYVPAEAVPMLARELSLSRAEVHGVISLDRKSTRLNSSHTDISRMPSSA